MPKTGSNIYKRKDGRWEGRYPKGRKANGRIVYGYVFAKTCGEVKKQLSSVSKVLPNQTSQTENIAGIAKRWLSEKSLKVKPSTLAAYEAIVNLHILPALGQVEIRNLTTASVGEFTQTKLQTYRLNGGGGLSPKTVRDILSVLKGIINFAANERLVENPISITYPKQKQESMRVLSHYEQTALKNVLLSEITVYKAGILLCLYTGLRIGEVCGLRWRDFSPSFDKLTVRCSLRRIKNKSGGKQKTKLTADTPKSKSSLRDVPVPKFLSPILKGFIRSKDTFFLSTPENRLTEPRTLQNHFKRAIEAASISNANFHCLRRTFSTRCIEAGVDIKSLSEMLGHANVNITLNRYVHSSFEQKQESINKLEKYLGL